MRTTGETEKPFRGAWWAGSLLTLSLGVREQRGSVHGAFRLARAADHVHPQCGNGIFLPQSTDLAFIPLQAANNQDGRKQLPIVYLIQNYGDIDCIFGKALCVTCIR